MVKFMLIVILIRLISVKNKILIFYYNLYFFMRFMIIFTYIFKEDGIWINLSLGVGSEYYSILLGILRVWIIGVIFMSLFEGGGKKIIVFLIILFLMEIFFFSFDIILFYIRFEIRLVPTFFLVIYWGGNFERVRAAYYLIIYILLISFPLLVYIFNIYIRSLRFKFSLMKIIIWDYEYRIWGYLLLYLAFYIKIPIYLFHIWLPKAHVEAPVYGSIILAGVLLKMGRYGLIRLLEIFIKSSVKYNYLVFSVRVIGGIYIGIVCLVQIDLKRLVAYSSVVHINIILCSLITIFKGGFLGGYIIMVSHGLCSSGLFYIVNIYYERSGRRLLLLNKGILSKLPEIAMWWFVLCVVNFSFPFCIGFFSEILILRAILNWDRLWIGYIIIICFLRRAYSVNLFAFIQHGGELTVRNKFYLRVVQEFLVIFIHVYPLILVVLNLLIFM